MFRTIQYLLDLKSAEFDFGVTNPGDIVGLVPILKWCLSVATGFSWSGLKASESVKSSMMTTT